MRMVPDPGAHTWTIRWTARAGLLLLTVLAVYFTRERLHLDSAHYLAHSLNKGLPHVEHHRLVLALAELPALLAWWAHLPMELVLNAWSLTPVLWAVIAARICWRMGRPDLTLAAVLLQFLGRSEMFFSPVLETGYGATCAITLYAVWSAHPLPRGRWLGAWSALAALVVLSHPVHLTSYVVVAILVWQGAQRHRAVLALALGPLLLFAALKGFAPSDYESARLFSGWWAVAPHWTDADLWPPLAALFIQHYPDLLFLLASALIVWVRAGRKGGITIPLLGMVLSLFLVNTPLRADTPGWYHESWYMGLVTCSMLFIASCLRDARGSAIRVVCVVALLGMGWRWMDIAQEGSARMQRRLVIEEFAVKCAQQGGKCVVSSVHRAAPFDRWEWSLPMEALLLGLAAHDVPVSLISNDDLAHDPRYATLPDSMVLFRRFEPMPIDALHPRFRTRPGPYVALE
jgi:hypothetical protein